jgi:hypothetical protein
MKSLHAAFFGALALSALFTPRIFATTATSLSSFGGLEESAQKYFPSSNTFQSDTFANAVDEGGGVFKMILRYNSSGTMWWDGDRTTGNTDRGREEVKTLGTHQLIHQTFDYTTTWRTSSGFTGSGSFCHITQLKPVDGVEGSSGAPMVVTSIGSGSSSANVRYASASFSPANVFTAHTVRNITYAPGVFLAEKIRVTTTADGQNTGQVVVSLNGDAFQGVTNTEVCRPSSTEYYPKWGLYRGTSTSSGFGAADYIEHSNVTAGPSSGQSAVADPTFNPAAGSYVGTQNVTISTTTSGASIHYTTDGSTPTTTTGTLYSGPVAVGQSETLKAIAFESGFTNSNVTSASYTIQCAAPTFSPGSGTYINGVTVSLSTATSGASVRYTTDGSTPTSTTGTLYAGPISITATTTVKAIAVKSGLADSAVTTVTYIIQCDAPTFSPVAGTYSSAQTVSISTTTSGASIRYTIDGSTPTSATGTLYTGPITIGSTTTLKAIAFASGLSDSTVTSGTYTITVPQTAAPTFTPAGGTYSTTQNVSIASSTNGASIRYTTDGSTPTSTTGTLYTGPVTISVTTTLKAIAFASGLSDSTVSTATYTISSTLAFEAEGLSRTSSGATTTLQTDANTSGGQWISLDSTATGQFVEFTLPSIGAGTYSVKMSYKTNTNRGILNLKVDGTQVGGTLDQYASASTYPTTTFGNVTLAAGTHVIRLTVTGKNASSTSFVLSADKFTLTPVLPTVAMEAESLTFVTSGPTVTTQADANASGGTVAFFNATAAAQWVDFTTPSIPAGTYQIKFQYKQNTARGQHTLAVDGTQVGGTIDEYSTTSGYTQVTVGTVTLAATGTHTIRLNVTGKNASSTSFVLAPDSFTFVGQ